MRVPFGLLSPLSSSGLAILGRTLRHFDNRHAATLRLNVESLAVSSSICNTIASHLKGGDVVQLIGKVGVGKTAFARAIIRAVLQNGDEVVQSPTFSLAISYACRFPSVSIVHIYTPCI